MLVGVIEDKSRGNHIIYRIPCHCRICKYQYADEDEQRNPFNAYLGYLNIGQVRDVISKRSKSMEEDRGYLKCCIERHGNAILRYWRSLTKYQRQQLLQTARPGLYPSREPLIEIGLEIPFFKDKERQEEFRTTYLLPFINLESLSQDASRLIALLHCRVQYPPQDFAAFDNTQISNAWNQCRLSEHFASGCVIALGDDYGTVQKFDPYLVHMGFAFSSPRALLILEAQMTLLGLLRQISGLILAQTCPSGFTQTELIEKSQTSWREDAAKLKLVAYKGPKPDTIMWDLKRPDLDVSCKWRRCLKSRYDDAVQSSGFGSCFEQAAFLSPPQFSIYDVATVIENQTNEVLDELWLLQTDPEYFSEYLGYSQKSGLHHHPDLSMMDEFNEVEVLKYISCEATLGVFLQAREWVWLRDVCRKAMRLYEEGLKVKQGRFQLNVAVFENHYKALGSLEAQLRKAKSFYGERFLTYVTGSPNFMHLFQLKMHEEIKERVGIRIMEPHELYPKDPLGWCLLALTLPENLANHCAHPVVFQRLDHLLEKNPREARRIDDRMHRCLSALAAIEKLLDLCAILRPIIPTPDPELLCRDYPSWQLLSKTQYVAGHWPDLVNLSAEITPRDRFRVKKGPKNEAWLSQWSNTHKSLQAVWKKARDVYEKILKGQGVSQDLIDPHLEMMSFGDTAEHTKNLEDREHQIIREIESTRVKVETQSTYIPFDGLNLGSETVHKATLMTQSPAKQKTRPAGGDCGVKVANGDEHVLSQNTVLSNTTPSLYHLKASSDSWRVIEALFPQADNGIPTKNIRWGVFTSAMVDFGFTVEPNGGSVYTFSGDIWISSDTTERQKKNINVHRPHPDPELSPIVLRSIGRRFNRRFGWERAHFDVIEG